MRLQLIFVGLILVLTMIGAVAHAAEDAPVVVRLWPGAPPTTGPFDSTDTVHRSANGHVSISGIKSPSMSGYLPDGEAKNRPAVLICPGGGYSGEAAGHEGAQVAERLAANGVVGFVLRYRLPEGAPPAADQLPVPQQDVFRAIQILRSRASEWGIDPNRIGVMGFSAGGHLAATAVTLYDQASSLAEQANHDAISGVSARPDFGILLYPVITMAPPAVHMGSRNRLLGKDPDAALIARFSPEQHVTAQTPPLFIMQAEDDHTVQVANSVMMAAAAAKAGVPCELHLLHAGGHGFGMGKSGAETSQWFDQLMAWMRGRGLLAESAGS